LNSKRTLLTFVLVGGIVIILGLTFAQSRAAGAPAVETPTPLVLSQAPSPTSTVFPNTVPAAAPTRILANAPLRRFTGNLLSASQANIGFQMAGRVQEVKVKEGDRVKAGTVLVVLDTTMLQIQVQQAQAAYDSAKAGFDKVRQGPTRDDVTVAKSDLDRAKASLDQAQAAYDRIGGASNPFIGMSPQSVALQQASSAYQAAVAQYDQAITHPTDTELRQAQAQMDQAQAALNLAKQNLVNATLTAPIDGTVTVLSAKLGESVAPGTPVATVADLSRMQVQVSLDETSLATIKLNQTATLTLDALGGRSLTGHVSKIAENGTTTGGIVSVPVTIDIDPTDAPIYPGLSANVEFQGGDQ
jgi:multidrug resistance efflux pump